MAQPPASSTGYGGASLLDLEKCPTAQEFVARCHDFFREVKDLYVPWSQCSPSPLKGHKGHKGHNINIGIRDDLLTTYHPIYLPIPKLTYHHQNTRLGPRNPTEQRVRARQRLLRGFLPVHAPGPEGRVGGAGRTGRAPVPTRTHCGAHGRVVVYLYHDRLCEFCFPFSFSFWFCFRDDLFSLLNGVGGGGGSVI